MQKIIPCLWFDDNAEEAVDFYTSIFRNSKKGAIARYDEPSSKVSGKPEGSVMTVAFQLNGQDFLALNGGPQFPFTPAISLFVHCTDDLDGLFEKLSHGGEIMMPLGEYPFSERYAFFKDRFGLAWQLMRSPQHHIAPSLLFVGEDLGKAEEAVRFYTSVFKEANIDHILLYKEGEEGEEGTVKHASFHIGGQEFMAMDGAGEHHFAFNESISFIVNCTTQEEVDHYWSALSEGGQEVECGWLKDRFGVSWQVVPTVLEELLQDKDVEKAKRVMQAMLQMKKLDIDALQQAAEG